MANLVDFLAGGKKPSHANFNPRMTHSLGRFMDASKLAGQNISIQSGYRSPAEQKVLFDKAVKKYGSRQAARKWVAPPGRSQHNKGNAADLAYGNNAAKEWAHKNAGQYGMNFRMGHEPWHIETAANNLPQNTQQLAGQITPQNSQTGSQSVPGLFNAIPQAKQPFRPSQDPNYHAGRMEESQESFLNQQSSMMSQMHKGMGKEGEKLEKAHKGASVLESLFSGRQARMKMFGGMFGGLFG